MKHHESAVEMHLISSTTFIGQDIVLAGHSDGLCLSDGMCHSDGLCSAGCNNVLQGTHPEDSDCATHLHQPSIIIT